MLKEISVKKLFGYLNYSILDLDVKPVTFLIAKNGMGKTTLLKMLNDLGNNNYEVFRKTEYEKIEFKFVIENDLVSLIFSRDSNGSTYWNKFVNGLEEPRKKIPKGFHGQPTKRKKVEWLELHTEIVERASCGVHWTINGQGHYDEIEVLTELKEYVEQNLPKEGIIDIDFLNSWKVIFISADRLRTVEDNKFQDVVNVISNEMVQSMNEHVVKASESNKTFEHDFLLKLLKPQEENLTIEELKEKLANINSLESKVKNYGLFPDVEPIQINDEKLDPTQLKTLNTFLNDKKTRLEPHLKFLKKLELFEKLVNVSLAKKEIKPDKNEGIIVYRDGNVRLKLDQLSSGEQHLIIIAHKLIFSIPDKYYVLIDEPELSMHLEWQSAFASMLEEISKLKKLRFFCATHSPSIIDSRISDTRNIKTNE